MTQCTKTIWIAASATLVSLLGASAATARVAPLLDQPSPAWSAPVSMAPPVYLRPLHTTAFASCEWVRVRTVHGARWRPLCK